MRGAAEPCGVRRRGRASGRGRRGRLGGARRRRCGRSTALGMWVALGTHKACTSLRCCRQVEDVHRLHCQRVRRASCLVTTGIPAHPQANGGCCSRSTAVPSPPRPRRARRGCTTASACCWRCWRWTASQTTSQTRWRRGTAWWTNRAGYRSWQAAAQQGPKPLAALRDTRYGPHICAFHALKVAWLPPRSLPRCLVRSCPSCARLQRRRSPSPHSRWTHPACSGCWACCSRWRGTGTGTRGMGRW